MILVRDWLWDRKITIKKAKDILKDPANKHFFSLAAVLLSRKNTPKEVFKYYLKPLIFLRNWNKIKSQMRKDAWNNPRIEFWQAIYNKLKEKYPKKTIVSGRKLSSPASINEFCAEVANMIKSLRKEKKMTQKSLAKKLKISQQVISRVESGKENISLLTLKKIADNLGVKIKLEISLIPEEEKIIASAERQYLEGKGINWRKVNGYSKSN